jgi:leader peptidase (prepilin peptidase) / N-methyltransferase
VLADFIALSIEIRIVCIGLLALACARFINWAIVHWAYFKRPMSPWAAPPKGYPPRSWRDHWPILGWLFVRREAAERGQLFWLRPLLIELVFPLAMAWYYHFYVSGGALSLGQAARLLVQTELHYQFFAHFILFVLMMIATFIDFDEQSIPDYVTIPGTVIGLLGAALAPIWLPFHQAPLNLVELHANLPDAWPATLDGPWGLVIGLTIIGVWGFALLDRRWIGRQGFAKGLQYFLARMFRQAWLWKTVCAVTCLLGAGVYWAWATQWPAGRWPYLMSSLLGLAFAGGVTWAVRLSASWGLRVEALGFGDVTLMAMIGTYIGWQPSMLVFFIAPLVSIAFVLLRWMITGDTATPYGPYLCAATVVVLVWWDALWVKWAASIFELGPSLIVGIIVSCVVLMGAMLWIWRLIKEALGIAGH